MKIKFFRFFVFFTFYLLPSTFYLYSEIPPGFDVYFNKPTGTSDANSPGLDVRFYDFINSATLTKKTTIYAAFYDIDNSTAIDALNLA
ncbi:MAG: hypothetical protein Q7K21_01310, partial [Elusimicrobiota bacterium]|nr:hypothetical protein [Elusimicrobiota bacterium]